MKYLIKNKAWNIVQDYNINILLYLLIDRPDEVNIYDDFIWRNNKKYLYRKYDLPCVYHDDNFGLRWFKNNHTKRYI